MWTGNLFVEMSIQDTSYISADYSNTYYHLDFAHIQRKKPFFNGQVFIAFDELRSFDYAQCDVIENCNLHVTLI